LYFPWLVGSGAPQHDDHVRGGFVGLSLTTTRAHLTRAVLEGVALNAAWLVPHVANLAGAHYDEVAMGGGGASSDLWAAIMADTLGMAVHQLDGARTTNARGAAFLALAQLGHISLDDVPDLLRVHRTHRPDPARHALYQSLLERFLDFHDRNRPFYASLNPHQEATS
jgi:xylulokinase